MATQLYLVTLDCYHGNRFPEGLAVLCIHEFHATCPHVSAVYYEEDLPCSEVSCHVL